MIYNKFDAINPIALFQIHIQIYAAAPMISMNSTHKNVQLILMRDMPPNVKVKLKQSLNKLNERTEKKNRNYFYIISGK